MVNDQTTSPGRLNLARLRPGQTIHIAVPAHHLVMRWLVVAYEIAR